MMLLLLLIPLKNSLSLERRVGTKTPHNFIFKMEGGYGTMTKKPDDTSAKEKFEHPRQEMAS